MLSAEEVRRIAQKFANKETLDEIAKDAFEAHRSVFRAAGMDLIPDWDEIGVLARAAWAMSVASAGEHFIDMCVNVATTVHERAETVRQQDMPNLIRPEPPDKGG